MNKKYEEYLNSPYRLLGIEERSFMTKSDETLTIDPSTGEYYTMKKVSKDKKVLNDELVYTKLYHDSFSRIVGLSHPALKIFLYACVNIRPIQQIVILNIPDVSIACSLANSTVYNAIYELLDSKIISKKLGSNIEFWFDPNVFFNGNRLRIIK
jgi:hypothetical protein